MDHLVRNYKFKVKPACDDQFLYENKAYRMHVLIDHINISFDIDAIHFLQILEPERYMVKQESAQLHENEQQEEDEYYNNTNYIYY